MARKIILIGMVILLLLGSLSFAVVDEILVFNNSLRNENFTISGLLNATRYISVPKYVRVNNFTFTLTGRDEVNHTQRRADSLNFTPISTIASSAGMQTIMENWVNHSTPAGAGTGTKFAHLEYNITLNFNQTVNLTRDPVFLRYSIGNSLASGSATYQVYATNASDDKILIENQTILPSNCTVRYVLIPNNTLRFNKTFVLNQSITWTGGGSGNVLFCDKQTTTGGNLWFINNSYFIGSYPSPQNVTIEIGDTDNIKEYNFLDKLNTTQNVSINGTAFDEILGGGCDCNRCTNLTYSCVIPVTFESLNPAQLEYHDINLTYSWGVDQCSEFTMKTLNLTFLHFHNRSKVPVDFATNIDFWIDPTIVRNFSTSGVSQTNYSLCITPNWTVISSNMLIQYENGSGLFEYSTFNTTLNNQTKNWSLFVDGGTTQVTLTVTDLGGDPVAGAFVNVLKFNVGAGVYETVEILETDGDGQTIANIVLFDAFYRFIISYQGVVRLVEPESGGVRVLTTSKNFQIDLGDVTWFDNFDTISNVAYTLTYNNDTQFFTFTWADPSADVHQGCLRVIQRNRTQDRFINDTCVTSAASTITQFGPTITAGNSYIATAYFKFDQEHTVAQIIHAIAELYDFATKGANISLFFSFFVILGLVLVGLPSPVISLSLMLIGFIVTFALGMYQIGLGLVAGIVVLVLILILKSRSS